MTLKASQVHVDAALTNLTIKYKPAWMIADMLSPVVNQAKQSNKYFVWDRADTFRVYNDEGAERTEAREIDMKLSTELYFADKRHLKIGMSDEEMENADSVLSLRTSKTEFVKNALMLGREKRVAALYTNVANYPAGHSVTLAGSNQWNDAAYAGNPATDIQTGVQVIAKAIWIKPNTIVMTTDVWNVYKENDKIREKYKYVENSLSMVEKPKMIEWMEFFTPEAIETTSAEGAGSDTTAYVWGKDVCLAYVNRKRPTKDSISFSYSFRWNNFTTKVFREEGKSATYIESKYFEDVKIVASYAGYIIKNAIS